MQAHAANEQTVGQTSEKAGALNVPNLKSLLDAPVSGQAALWQRSYGLKARLPKKVTTTANRANPNSLRPL